MIRTRATHVGVVFFLDETQGSDFRRNLGLGRRNPVGILEFVCSLRRNSLVPVRDAGLRLAASPTRFNRRFPRACYAPFPSGLARWHPCRDASVIAIVSGGVARSSLNRRLHAGKPSASEAAFSRQVHSRLSQRLYGLATPITPTAMRSPALPA